MNRRSQKLTHRLAIPGIHRILAAFNVLVYVLMIINPNFGQFLELAPEKVLGGQIWRSLTGFLLPTIGGVSPEELLTPLALIYLLIKVQLLLMMGDALEGLWGVVKFNGLLVGTALTVTIASVIVHFINPHAGYTLGVGTTFTLYMVIFLSFATEFPNTEFRLFFVLPVKVKYLAMIAILVLLMGVSGSGLGLAHTLGCYSVLLFLLAPRFAQSAKARQRRTQFEQSVITAAREHGLDKTRTCSVCGVTESDAPDREFRVDDDGNDICMTCVERTLRS